MTKHRRVPTLLAVAVLGLLLIVPLQAPAQQAGGPTVARSEDGGPMFRPGDLVTASGKIDSLIRMRPRRGGKRYKLTKVPMGVRLKPKGITHSSFCERVAIANSTNVVIYDTWHHGVTVIEHNQFGLIADVEWDMQCNLIIADMGGDSVGRWPRDGRVWMYSADGRLQEIAKTQNWVNPAFLEMDEWGTLYIVDKAAGPPMPNTGGQWHFDAIYKVGAPRYTHPVVLYNQPGLTVTAFAGHPDGSFLIGNGDQLLHLDKLGAYPICGGDQFRRINGVDLNSKLEVFFVDGYDVFEDTVVYRMEDDYTCSLKVLAGGKMVQGAQGLAAGLPQR